MMNILTHSYKLQMKLDDPLMNTCCIVSQDGESGRVRIKCKKNLWLVDCPTLEQALNEARHYFGQYLRDGEYDDLIRPAININTGTQMTDNTWVYNERIEQLEAQVKTLKSALKMVQGKLVTGDDNPNEA